MYAKKIRDITLLSESEERAITVACDSCGGIGNSKHDIIKIEEEIVGYFTARVPLIETLSFRAIPISIVNTLSVEMEHRGRKLLQGVIQAMEEFNCAFKSHSLSEECLTGSTEENIQTTQTALGITVIGEYFYKNEPRKATKGDVLAVIGVPKVGDEVVKDIQLGENEIITLSTLSTLLQWSEGEIIPVGSKGIEYEMTQFQIEKNTQLRKVSNNHIDLKKSAGPATCVLAVLTDYQVEELRKNIHQPLAIVGHFV